MDAPLCFWDKDGGIRLGKSPRCRPREGMWIAGSDKARGCSAGAERGGGAPVRRRGAQQMSKEQGGWEWGEGGGS